MDHLARSDSARALQHALAVQELAQHRWEFIPVGRTNCGVAILSRRRYRLLRGDFLVAIRVLVKLDERRRRATLADPRDEARPLILEDALDALDGQALVVEQMPNALEEQPSSGR